LLQKEFIEERARLIRVLAGKADPFIRRRLLDLVQNRYENGVPITPSKALKDIGSVPGLAGFFTPSSER
jgi:hypothetical protein